MREFTVPDYIKNGANSNNGGYQGQAYNLDRYLDILSQYNAQQKASGSASVEQEEPREMGLFDRIAAGAGELGEGIMNWATGNGELDKAREEDFSKGNILGAALNMAPGLIVSAPSAMALGVRDLSEAATGRDLQNVDWENNTISGNDLTLSQRAGSLVNAGINLMEPAFGAEARALGGIANATKAGLKRAGKESAADMISKLQPAEGRGLLRQAVMERGGSSKLGTAAGIIGDTASEAGEEFVQSLADDARNESIDGGSLGRATEAAGWGALGGAMMSGFGNALSSAADVAAGNAGTNTLNAQQISGKNQSEKVDPFGPRTSQYTPGYQEYLSEKQWGDDQTKMDGGMGAVVVPDNQGLGTNEHKVGIDSFRSMWDKSTAEGRSLWANRLQLSEDQITDVLRQDDNTALATLNNQTKKVNSKGIRVTIGRNPNTNRSSEFDSYLVGFELGSGMHLNNLACQLSGGDVDGDTRFEFIQPNDNNRRMLPTQMFTNVTQGDNFDWEYMPLLTNERARQILKTRALDEAQYVVGTSDVIVNDQKFKSLLDTALNDIASARVNESSRKSIGNNLNNLRYRVEQILKDNGFDPDLADIYMSRMLLGAQTILYDYEDVLMDTIDEAGNKLDTKLVEMVSIPEDADPRDFHIDEGNIKGENLAEVIHLLDFVFSATDAQGSQFFRQDQSIKYIYGKRFPMIARAYDAIGGYEMDALTKRMIGWMGIIELGVDVQDTIGKEFRMFIEYELFNRLGLNKSGDRHKGMGSSDASYNITVEDFIETFVNVYNEAVSMYNEALEKTTIDKKTITSLGVVTKNHITKESDGRYNKDTLRAMIQTLGALPAVEIFADENLSEKIGGATIKQMLDHVLDNNYNRADITFNEVQDEDTRNLLNGLLEADFAERELTANLVQSQISEIPRISIDKVGEPRHFQESLYILDSMFRSMDPRVAEWIGLTSIDDVSKLPPAVQKIIFDGSEDERTNFILIKNIQWKMKDAIRLKKEYQKTVEKGKPDESLMAMARNAAMKWRDGSALMEEIIDEFLRDDSSSIFYDAMTSSRSSYADKKRAYHENLFRTRQHLDPLILSAIRTDSTEMGRQTISQRAIAQKRSIGIAISSRYENVMRQVDGLSKAYEGNPKISDIDKSADLKAFLTDCMFMTSERLAFAELIDDPSYSLSDAEKGQVVDKTAANYAQMVITRKGMQTSILDDIVYAQNGQMSPDQLFSNKYALHDIFYNQRTITVYDGEGHTKVNLETLLEGCPEPAGKEITWNQWMWLINKHPMLLNAMTTNVIALSPDGKGAIKCTTGEFDKLYIQYTEKNQSMPNRQQRIRSTSEMKARAEISNDLLNSPVYKAMLASSAFEECHGDTAEMYAWIHNAHEQWIDYIAYYIAKPELLFSTEQSNVSNDMFRNSLKALKEAMTTSLEISNAVGKGETIDDVCLTDILAQVDFVIHKGHIRYLIKDLNEKYKAKIKLPDDLSILATQEGKMDELMENLAEIKGSESDHEIQYLETLLTSISVSEAAVASTGADNAARNINYIYISMMGVDRWSDMAGNINIPNINDNELVNSIIDARKEIINEARKELLQIAIDPNEELLFTETFDASNFNGNIDEAADVFIGKLKLINENRFNRDNPFNINDIVEQDRIRAAIRVFNSSDVTPRRIREAGDKLTKIIREQNNIILKNITTKVMGLGNSKINSSAVLDGIEYSEFLENYIDDKRQSNDLHLGDIDTTSKPKMPPMHHGRTDVAYTATTARFRASTASIGMNVGLNGIVNNGLNGFVFIPHDIECNSEPSATLTKEQFIADPSNMIHFKGCKFRIEGDASNELRRISDSFDINTIQDGATMLIYHPSDCTCGICVKHSIGSDVPGMENSLTFLESLCQILDDSQEASNLKLKKTLNSITHISDKWLHENSVVKAFHSVQPNETIDQSIDAYIVQLKKYRRQLNRHLQNGLNEARIDTDDDITMPIVTAMSSIIEVTFESGHKIAISLDDLARFKKQGYSGNEFDNKLGNFGKIASMETMLTSIDTINKKIEHDIASDRFDLIKGKRNNFKAVFETARRSITDWSNWKIGEIDILAYADSGAMVKPMIPQNFVPEGETSARQKWEELLSRRAAISRIYRGKKLAYLSNDDQIKSVREASNNLMQSYSDEFTVTKVVCPNKDNLIRGVTQKYDRINNIVTDSNDGYAIDDKATIIFDFGGKQSDIDRNIRNLVNDYNNDAWGYNYILVEDSQTYPHKTLFSGEVKINNKTFKIIDVRRYKNRKASGAVTDEYSTTVGHIEDICFNFGDVFGVFNLPDGGIFHAPGYKISPNFTRESWYTYDVDEYMNNGSIELVSPEEMADLAQKWKNRDKKTIHTWMNLKKSDNISTTAKEEKLDDFFARFSQTNNSLDPNGFVTTSIRLHDIVAIAKQEILGETRYTPIFFEGSGAMQNIDGFTDVRIDGTEISFSYSTNIEVSFGESNKGFINKGRAFKGMSIEMSPEMEKKIPRVDYLLDSDGNTFNRINIYETKTQDGRTKGQRNMIFNDNVYGMSRIVGMSARFERDDNGEYRLNRYLSDWAITPENEKPGSMIIHKLFSNNAGNHPAWKLIADGLETFYDPSKATDKDTRIILENANYAIKQLAFDAVYNGNGIELSSILESYDFESAITINEDGSISINKDDVRRKPLFHKNASGILARLDNSYIMDMFHVANNTLCPSSVEKHNSTDYYYKINADGDILTTINGEPTYTPGSIEIPDYGNTYTGFGENQGSAANGHQQRRKNALRYGLTDQKDMELFLANLYYDVNNSKPFREGFWGYEQNDEREYGRYKSDYDPFDAMPIDSSLVKGSRTYSYARRQFEDRVIRERRNFENFNVKVISEDGNIDRNFIDSEEYKILVQRLNDAFGIESPNTISQRTFSAIIVNCCCGSSIDKNGNLPEVPIADIKKAVQKVESSLKQGEYFLEGGIFRTSSRGNDRITIGKLPRNIAYDLYNSSTRLQEIYKSRGFEGMCEDADESMQKTWDTIASITIVERGVKGKNAIAQQDALKFLSAYIEKTYGSDICYEKIGGSIFVRNLIQAESQFFKDLYSEDSKWIDKFLEQSEISKKEGERIYKNANRRRGVTVYDSGSKAGKYVHEKDNDLTTPQKIIKYSERSMRLCAMLNIGVTVGNYASTATNTMLLKLGTRIPFSPNYRGAGSAIDYSNPDNKSLCHDVASTATFKRLVTAFQEARLVNEDQMLLEGFSKAEDKDAFLDELYGGDKNGKHPKLSGLVDRLFTITSASTLMATTRAEIFLEQFAVLAYEKGLADQMMPVRSDDGNDITAMEHNLKVDALGWLVESMRIDSPSRSTVLQALNYAAGGTMGRENVISAILTEVFERSPEASFAFSAFLTPFYRYTTNLTGKILNTVLPMSTLHHVVTRKLKAIDSNSSIDWDAIDGHKDTAAAMMSDALKMPIGWLAILIGVWLSQFSGGFEPPEDEDKVVDFREWTLCGKRICTEWWAQDVIGLALPLACTMQSFMNGKPRIDILINGMATILSSNPLIKINDAVNAVFYPEEYEKQLDDAVENYKNAPGGKPNPFEQITSNMTIASLSVIGRIVTPSIIKEVQNYMMPYQVSYNRVYAPDSENVDSQHGDYDDTIRVPYEEAQLRKFTRNNPLIGFILDLTNSSSTSYVALGNPLLGKQGMPNIVVYDEFMREVSNRYSVMTTDSDGNRVEKSESEKEKVALDVIATLESYSDMEELRSRGFTLDSDTRFYVSRYLALRSREESNAFFDWYNSDAANAYVLGGGDYQTGVKIRNDEYQRHLEYQNYISDMYKYKLWSSEMKEGIQRYFMENTQYWKDNNGEIYNSGFSRATSILPWKEAQGTTTDPQGTMGREGDWATPAAYNKDITTGERALVPVGVQYDETPDLDDWLNDDDDGSSTGNKNKNSTSSSGYPSSYGSRRSGGGSRGGSGGSAPNLYSRVPDSNISNPTQSRGGSLKDSRYDYLRPSFETKGSREATRRQDF